MPLEFSRTWRTFPRTCGEPFQQFICLSDLLHKALCQHMKRALRRNKTNMEESNQNDSKEMHICCRGLQLVGPLHHAAEHFHIVGFLCQPFQMCLAKEPWNFVPSPSQSVSDFNLEQQTCSPFGSFGLLQTSCPLLLLSRSLDQFKSKENCRTVEKKKRNTPQNRG